MTSQQLAHCARVENTLDHGLVAGLLENGCGRRRRDVDEGARHRRAGDSSDLSAICGGQTARAMDPDAGSRPPGAARDGDVDGAARWLQQIVQGRRGAVREECLVAAREDCREPPATQRQIQPPDRIYAPVEAMKAACRNACAYGAISDLELQELRQCDHTPLAGGDGRLPAPGCRFSAIAGNAGDRCGPDATWGARDVPSAAPVTSYL